MLNRLYPTIKEFAFLPDRALDSFRLLTKNAGSSFEVRQIIGKEYLSAIEEEGTLKVVYKQGNTVVTSIDRADRVYIITSIDSITDGSKVVISFVHNRNPDKQPWEMQKAITEADYSNENYIDLGDKPREMLKNFAYWPSFHDDLKTLKNQLALSENWSYVEFPLVQNRGNLICFAYQVYAKVVEF